MEKNKALTEALQTLATEHHQLKNSLSKSRRSSTLRTLTEDDFYDAESGQQPSPHCSVEGQNSEVIQKLLFHWVYTKQYSIVHIVFIAMN